MRRSTCCWGLAFRVWGLGFRVWVQGKDGCSRELGKLSLGLRLSVSDNSEL